MQEQQIHNQQKQGPKLKYTRIRKTSEFTYVVYRCSGCGEAVTADNLFSHAARQHNTIDLEKIDGESTEGS